jgi:predicted ArsR family transcriptional regulator
MAVTEPTGTPAQMFWMLAILGGEADTVQIREAMAREGDVRTQQWVRACLRSLVSQGLVCVARRGGPGLPPSLWRLTEEGAALAAAEGEPLREPCGLGWPA